MPAVLITHSRLISEGPHHRLLREAGFEIRLPPAEADSMQAEALAEADPVLSEAARLGDPICG